jgi:rubrerythrin
MNPQPKLTIELYGQPVEITKESVSNAISQITPEERERLMRLNEAPDKPDDIICPHCDYKLDDEEADQVCDEGCPSCRRRFEIN